MHTQKIIDAYLRPYNEESRFLKSFEYKENIGRASFEIKSDFYCHENHPVQYFTAAEMQICINQLLYIVCTHAGLIPFDDNEDLNPAYIHKLASGKYITEQKCSFKAALKTDRIIEGEMQLVNHKKIGDTIVADCSFNFENKCLGTVRVVIKG